MAENDPVSNIVMTIMAAIIGIALICVGLIPLATDWITTQLVNDAASYQPLLELVVIVVILGVIMGVLKMFSNRSER